MGRLISVKPQSPIPAKGTRLLRKGRFSSRNFIYQVSTATADRMPVFEDFLFARTVILSMKREDDAGHTETLAFVVMPDHLHWLFQLKSDRSLAGSINSMKSHATRTINRLSRRQGSLWQKGFYDRAIRRDEDLRAIARYIVANPLRAGIARTVAMYPFWDSVWV